MKWFIIVPVLLAAIAAFLATIVFLKNRAPSQGTSNFPWGKLLKNGLWVIAGGLTIALLIWILYSATPLLGSAWNRRPDTILTWLVPALIIAGMIALIGNRAGWKGLTRAGEVAGLTMIALAAIMWWLDFPLTKDSSIVAASPPAMVGMCGDLSTRQKKECIVGPTWSAWIKSAPDVPEKGAYVCRTAGVEEQSTISSDGVTLHRFRSHSGLITVQYRAGTQGRKCDEVLAAPSLYS